jgi:hypothetical protein
MPDIEKTIINNNYRQVLKQDNGAAFVKVDLHVHTPASGDAQSKNRYKFKFDITNIPKSLASSKILAKKIVDRCKTLDIKLIAITDHNTPSNTHPEDLTNTWYKLIRDAAEGEDLCVLPGVEISTDDLHILVILDPHEEDPAAFTTHRINFLLQDCKFDLMTCFSILKILTRAVLPYLHILTAEIRHCLRYMKNPVIFSTNCLTTRT